MMFLRLAFCILLLPPLSAGAQSPPELQAVERLLFNKLEGSFDNEPQLYLAAELGAPDLSEFTRRHINIGRSQAADDGAGNWFVVQVHAGGSRMPVSGTAWYRFEPTADFAGVRMWRYAEQGDGRQSEPDPMFERCRFLWRAFGEGVRGRWESGRCRQDDIWQEQEWILTEAGLSRLVREFDRRGRLKAGRADGIAEHFSRVSQYDCFVALERPGKERYVKNPVTLHDGGDIWRFDPDGEEPMRYYLLLRNSLWPSRSGRNFLPLLHLDVFRTDQEAPIGAGWAQPASDRVGFNFVGGSARCKRMPVPPD